VGGGGADSLHEGDAAAEREVRRLQLWPRSERCRHPGQRAVCAREHLVELSCGELGQAEQEMACTDPPQLQEQARYFDDEEEAANAYDTEVRKPQNSSHPQVFNFADEGETSAEGMAGSANALTSRFTGVRKNRGGW